MSILNWLQTTEQTEITSRPMVFEVFTNSEDESKALELILGIDMGANAKMKQAAKQILGEKGISFIKNIVKR